MEEENLISWTGPETHQDLISHSLRKLVIIILVGMAFLTLFWQKSVFTAIIFFGLAIILSTHFLKKAKNQRYAINKKGVLIGDYLYPYKNLKSFWINYDPDGIKELSLEIRGFLISSLQLPLYNQDPFQVREALMNFLPEKYHQEEFDTWLKRKLGL